VTRDPLEIVLPEGWPRPHGYSNGVLAPAGSRLLFIAGQVGWDETETLVDGGFVDQFEQALRNVVEVVEAAGGSREDLVRLTLYVTDRREYLDCLEEVGDAYRRVMGRHYPAMALLEVAALLEAGARVEIEGTAALTNGIAQVMEEETWS
jgi:enamine deaminase RidA (YjgF/YER057c/UK114 family)